MIYWWIWLTLMEWEENEEAAASFGGRSVVGRIISKHEIKERRFTSIFSRLWKGVSDWDVKVFAEEGESSYVGITMKSREDARMIVEKQPWIFNGGVLLLEDWPDTGQWKDAKLDKMVCWVRIKGIPLKAFTKKNVIRLAEMAGELVDLKWINEQRMFLNGYVRVRIGFPLHQSIFVGRYVPSGGKQHWVQFKFERLPLLCFKCGIWGHEQQACSSSCVTVRGEDGQNVPKYGNWLKEEDAMPNCFLAFQQAKLQQVETEGIQEEGEARRESSGSGDDAGELRSRETVVVGERSVEADGGAEGGAVMGVVHNGKHVVERGNGIREARGTVMEETFVDMGLGSKLDGKGIGPRIDGLDTVGSNKLKMDKLDIRKSILCDKYDIAPVHLGLNDLDLTEQDRKKRKNAAQRSEEERERDRRARDKGKEIEGNELGIGYEGIYEVGSGVELGGAAKTIGQRRKVSIKDKARHKSRQAAARGPTGSLGGMESLGNHEAMGSRVGEQGEFIFNTGVGSAGVTDSRDYIEGELNVRIISSSPGHIVARVAGEGFLPWTLTCFYGHPEASHRVFSWKLLRDICNETQGAWLCVGDFNEIVSLTEKSGGRLRSSEAMEAFKEVLDDCQLIDFGSIKHDFTWCNEHENDQIMERLDRGLCNVEWLQQFDGADIQLLDWWESDHRPLVVDIPIREEGERSGHGKRISRFHFEEAWCEEEECRDIIANYWNEELVEESAERFRRKTVKVGKVLEVYDRPNLPAQLRVIDLKLLNGAWDEDFIRANFNPDDANLILQLSEASAHMEDKVMWHYSNNGEYSVRSGLLSEV
ncbi:hypothetical protein F8388_008285 [Cannabis sativa]|uniref:Zinc knuckle CX2CX4HX4C domain-containing protein n=1 Tax=Cannabis sativa TaxID=3483 RepID=A0A7J6DQY7_CANSA|nr:hypothetical protein G4B88_012086 [Cannabis sativa]KAF4359723.1 hypothetical protein F8388_008285 [Cannabis sativa]